MTRTVIGIGLGLGVALVVALFMWWLGFYLFPPSPVLDQNPGLVRADPGRLPFLPLAWEGLGQGLGAFVGGLTALRLAQEDAWSAWVLGAALAVLMGAILLIGFPRPLWFTLLDLILTGAGA